MHLVRRLFNIDIRYNCVNARQNSSSLFILGNMSYFISFVYSRVVRPSIIFAVFIGCIIFPSTSNAGAGFEVKELEVNKIMTILNRDASTNYRFDISAVFALSEFAQPFGANKRLNQFSASLELPLIGGSGSIKAIRDDCAENSPNYRSYKCGYRVFGHTVHPLIFWLFVIPVVALTTSFLVTVALNKHSTSQPAL